MNRKDPARILEFFRELRDCLLIVEGRKDAKSLNTLDLTNILAINGRPLITVADKVAELAAGNTGDEVARNKGGYSDIIILTDFDREGRHIAARLGRLLRAHKIHPNQRLRSRIMNLGFNRIEDIKMESILALGKRSTRARRSLTTERNARRRRSRLIEKGAFGRRGLPVEKIRGDDYVKAGSDIDEIRDKGIDKGKGSRGKAGHHRSGVRSD
jgi:5S rRNA maturation endonuclease (ribonuclease M5)